MIRRTGEVIIRMLADVKQATIGPLIMRSILPGTVVYTDGYDIYARLPEWGYTHRTVRHAAGGFVRDDDRDGFCEVQVNTMEGFWSLLRSWLRSHRGLSRERLPLYLGFFEFAHNVRRRGKDLLGVLDRTARITPESRMSVVGAHDGLRGGAHEEPREDE